MSGAPAAVLAAIERVSWTVPCLDCLCTVEVAYDQAADRVVIRHLVSHPLGAGAAALGWFVTGEIAAIVATADYEPAPNHVFVGDVR